MSKAPAKFTQADIARTLRAVKDAAYKAEVVIDFCGQIRIVPYCAPRENKTNKHKDNASLGREQVVDFTGDINL